MKLMKNPNTAADVNLLWAVFADLLPDGREITHEQIEAVLKTPRLSARYRTIVRRWRRRLFQERTVFLDGIGAQGRGFVSLTPDEMVRFGNRKVRQAGRQVKLALLVTQAPADEQLSEQARIYRMRLTAAVEHIAKEHSKTLREVGRALAPMKQLPRAAAQ